ncbi:MAG: hypothetical protein JXB47_10160 [Anaerolineae bacterium]|nr:hypothetical protein [Anaerolineae bacterium]
MHQHPFILVRIGVLDADGKPVFNPWWLIVAGPRRAELALAQVYTARGGGEVKVYFQRREPDFRSASAASWRRHWRTWTD